MSSPGSKNNLSLIKGLSIYEYLVMLRRPGRIHEISQAMSIPQSTIIRFLNGFIEAGYVVKNEESGDYSPTLRVGRLADALGSSFSIRDQVHPFLKRISHALGESASLAVMEDNKIVYLDSVEGHDRILRTLQRIGHSAPLSTTGVGKNFLLDFSREELNDYIESTGLEELTPRSIRTLEELKSELEKIQEQGFAVDNEECEEGVRCVAVPLRNYRNKIVAGISISAPASRLSGYRITESAEILKSAAAEIEGILGRE